MPVMSPLVSTCEPLEYVWETIGWEPLGTPGRTGMGIIGALLEIIFSQIRGGAELK